MALHMAQSSSLPGPSVFDGRGGGLVPFKVQQPQPPAAAPLLPPPPVQQQQQQGPPSYQDPPPHAIYVEYHKFTEALLLAIRLGDPELIREDFNAPANP
jgi:hypothetical protein